MTELYKGSEAARILIQGAGHMAAAIRKGYGPWGRSTCFRPPADVPRISNRVSEIAENINFDASPDNAGCYMVKQMLQRIKMKVGDGGTVAVVMLQTLLEKGYLSVSTGVNPMLLRRGIDKAAAVVADAIEDFSREMRAENIFQIALSACGGERQDAEIVSDVVSQIGMDGFILVEDSQEAETRIETTTGLFFDQGYLSPAFINREIHQAVEMENPLVLLYEGDLSNFRDICHLLDICADQRRNLLILARDVKGEALQGLILNKMKGVVQSVAVSVPGFGTRRKENFRIFSALCQCPIFNPENGLALSDCGIEICGNIKKAVIGKRNTLLQGFPGAYSEETVRLRKKYSALVDSSDSEDEKDAFEESLAFLSGGMAVIHVGGVSELEMFTRKDRIESAVRAIRSARKSGIVPGGGVAFLRAQHAVEPLMQKLTGDERTGAWIVKQCLESPLRQLAENAGKNAGVLLDKIHEASELDFGYDFEKDVYTNMFNAGIVDSAEAVRYAVVLACSTASTALTAGAFVTDKA